MDSPIDHQHVQNIAKKVMTELLPYIKCGVTEKNISDIAVQLFQNHGITQFWYYGVAALVLAGDRTPLSISGRDYQPSQTAISQNDVVTIDLSPTLSNIWGDYARTVYIHDGEAQFTPQTEETKTGHQLESQLHDFLIATATPDMRAHDLWSRANDLIHSNGFRNLDFKKNLGHSIEKHIGDRKYIEEGNMRPLKEFGLFTFEPHIQSHHGGHGYKHENIYDFINSHPHPL